MVTEDREEQPQKAHSSMEATLPGMVIDSREVQSEKAHTPIVVTLSGMEIDVYAEPLKPLSKIPSTIIPL